MGKVALITGITGQDGSYLAELLVDKGYKVYGTQRRSSTIITERIEDLRFKGQVQTFYSDLTDSTSLLSLLDKLKPEEVYNLASQSHVRVSFDKPVYTADVTALGPLRLLELLRIVNPQVRFYQASSSEMFGISPSPQGEGTPFMPQSPYGISKLFAYWATKAYRSGYKMFAANGILFNHESPRRGRTFVTQKIVYSAAEIKLGLSQKLVLGNLDSKRDWGHAKDYARAIYMITQHSEPDDWVVSTGYQYTVREFAERVFELLGLSFYDYVDCDNKFLRPNEVPDLCGNSHKIRSILGWAPYISFDQLVQEMVDSAIDFINRRRGEYVCYFS